MGRSSQKEAAENRRRVVVAASTLLRQKGVEAVGIDELMAEVGLTRGGFYKMFGSKEHLKAEACAAAFESAENNLQAACSGHGSDRLRQVVEFYLSPKPAASQCPIVTLAGDAAREATTVSFKEAFVGGLGRMARSIWGEKPSDQDYITVAAMVGTLLLRRAGQDPELTEPMEAAVLRFASTPYADR